MFFSRSCYLRAYSSQKCVFDLKFSDSSVLFQKKKGGLSKSKVLPASGRSIQLNDRKRILCRIRKILRLIIRDIGNIQILKHFK